MPDRIDAVVIEEFLRSKFGSDASIDVMRPGAWSAAYRVTRYDRDALAPGAVMAIADTDIVHGAYRNDVLAVINEHSEVKEHRDTKDLIATLRANGRLALSGEERTPPAPFERSVDDYLEMLHSTSTLARVRLGDRAKRFDEQVRAIFARHGLDRLRYDVVGLVWWGRPT